MTDQADQNPAETKRRYKGRPPAPETQRKKAKFLAILSQTGSVKKACAGVGISRQRAHQWERQDPAFHTDRAAAKTNLLETARRTRLDATEPRKTRFLQYLAQHPSVTVTDACPPTGATLRQVYGLWRKHDPGFHAQIDRHLAGQRAAQQQARNQKKAQFLEQLRQSDHAINNSAGPGKIDRMALHRWRRNDPEFNQAVRQALREKRMGDATRFLAELEHSGDLEATIEKTGADRRMFYHWRARYPEFQAATQKYVEPRRRWSRKLTASKD